MAAGRPVQNDRGQYGIPVGSQFERSALDVLAGAARTLLEDIEAIGTGRGFRTVSHRLEPKHVVLRCHTDLAANGHFRLRCGGGLRPRTDGKKANGNHKPGDESRAQARHARHPLKERAAGMKSRRPRWAYFWTVTAVLCEPNCAVTEVFDTAALAICEVVAVL